MTNLEAPVLVPHAAATGTSAGHKGETKYSYEIVFRSQHYALADNACREYLFLCEFFHVESAPAMELFQEVMGKTCTIYTVSNYDVIIYCVPIQQRLLIKCRNLLKSMYRHATIRSHFSCASKWCNGSSTFVIREPSQPWISTMNP